MYALPKIYVHYNRNFYECGYLGDYGFAAGGRAEN